MTGRGDRPQSPDGVTSRLTALAGVLWLTGGAAVIAVVPTDLVADGRPERVLGVGLAAVAIGLALLSLGDRVLPGPAYAAIVLLGSVAIAAVVWWAGPVGAAVTSILYVYVTVFTFIWLRPAVVPIVAVAALVHLGVLGLSGAPALLGTWLLVWIVAVVTGAVCGRVVAIQRELAAQRELLVEQLRAADTAKTTLLYTVVHELSRPMTGIVGFSETLTARRGELSDTERDQLVDRLAASSRRLDGMLRAMLSLGRLSQGVVVPRTSPTRLDVLLVQAVEVADLSTEVRVDGATDTLAVVDATQVVQAVANLLENGARHGGGQIGIEVAPATDGIVVCVTDEGPGIDDADKERVFEPFERGRSDDDKGGSGLGLALVREVARLHGGEAWLEDRPGGGTRACLLLPRR